MINGLQNNHCFMYLLEGLHLGNFMKSNVFSFFSSSFSPNWQDNDASKLQVHNIVSSNKVISKVSFPRGLDKISTKIIVNL